ncbi:unnamed protein product [Agarophyton chilense]
MRWGVVGQRREQRGEPLPIKRGVAALRLMHVKTLELGGVALLLDAEEVRLHFEAAALLLLLSVEAAQLQLQAQPLRVVRVAVDALRERRSRDGGVRAGGLRAGGLRADGLRADGLRADGLRAGGLRAGGVQVRVLRVDGVSSKVGGGCAVGSVAREVRL